jgi:2-polyprenyl-3-methyl-5-hydroxy-6-metoxy-1,4-benzoquinol methylase
MALDFDVANVPERFVPETMGEELIAAEHLARYAWAAPLVAGARVLDAGCGTGYGAAMLAEAGAAEVVGVDVAEAVVEAARSRAGARLAFSRADLVRLPFEAGSFDVVTCFEVIEHVLDPVAVLAELARALAPDGVLAISSPNADRYPPGNPHHVREFTTSEFRALLAEQFAEVRLLAQHQWISSAVLAERDLEPGAVAVRTVKATGRRLGSEAYTVALAGAGPLPEAGPTAALTGTVEVRRWLEHFDAQQRLLADQADYLRRLEALDAERRDLRRQLADGETALAEQRERVFTLEREARAELERLEDALAIGRAALAEERAARAAEREEQTEQAEDGARRLAAAEAELDGYRRGMEAVWSSLSWRATRPLRGAKRLLRR